MSTPKVSVCITAYNHEAFIRQALDSVIAQQVDFPIEILIGEDCSTDGTRTIVKEYERTYPNLIRAFYHSGKDKIVVDGRVTGRKNFANNLLHARGEYIALLDGDDFWLDEKKLALQVQFLDSNPDYTICFHNAIHVDENGVFGDRLAVPSLPNELDLRDILKTNPIPTMSCLFRNQYFKSLPDWFYKPDMADWPLHILNAARGKVRYMPVVMAAYRIHDGGEWKVFRDDLVKSLYSQIKVWKLLLDNKDIGENVHLRELIESNYQRIIRKQKKLSRWGDMGRCLQERREFIGESSWFEIKNKVRIFLNSNLSQ